MKTSRSDVTRDKQQTILPYQPNLMLGYSRCKLQFGDCFTFRETYTNNSSQIYLAKYHGRIKPVSERAETKDGYYILAQVANHMMTFTYERWILPEDVTETLPAKYVKPQIKTFFEESEKINH